MKCTSCGHTLESGDLFCPSCGTKVEGSDGNANPTAKENATKNSAASNENGNAVASAAKALTDKVDSDALKSVMKDKKKLAIIAGAIVAVIAAIALVASLLMGGGVPKKQVEQDFKANDIMTSGIVHSDFVNESPYELVKFSVTGQEKIKDVSFEEFSEAFLGARPESTVIVSYEGTMKNENFETQFTGVANYAKYNDSWQLLDDFETTSSTTTPLKGVDFLTPKPATVKTNEIEAVTSDFESDFKNDNGVYTSSASQTATYNFWFADDSAKNTRDFTFNNEKGWVPAGDVQVSDTKTSWKLAGRTFSASEKVDSSIGSGSSVGSYDSTFSFTDAPENTINAEYTMDFKGGKGNEEDYMVFHDYLLTGSLTGTPQHEFGTNKFTVEFNDAANGVTFTCSPSDTSLVAGSGTVNTLSIDMKTDKIYLEYTKYSWGPYNLSAKGLKFTENV